MVNPSIGKDTTSKAYNVDNLYGPWMVVDNRRRRQGLVACNSSNGFARGKASSGSIFAPLDVDGMDAELPNATSKNGDVEMLYETNFVDNVRGPKNGTVPVSHTHIHFTDMYKVSNPEKRPKAGQGAGASTSVVAMVLGQTAQVVENEGSSFAQHHAVVSIVEPGHLQDDRRRYVKGKGIMLKNAKENIQQRLNVRRNTDSRTILRPVTHEWVQNILDQLNSIVSRVMGDFEGVTKASISEMGLLEPTAPSDH
ncbi:hypothetical protein V6N11_058715 [Hibiscus sabdariffa]|uniref:Uncharacterized protein n=1 Tax=Hibiscus sabdariffa TaxID=183260 RepID=A0ABR2U5T6_9ROSI